MPPTIDSNLTLDAALHGIEIPPEIREQLIIIPVNYWSFDSREHRGQIVMHRDLADETGAIFEVIHRERFPVRHVIPVVQYGWSDDASMAANNSSGFNYRLIAGTSKLSQHAYGRAIDINPAFNPYRREDIIEPPGAVYDPSRPGTLLDGSVVVNAFLERGWDWGGHWQTRKDWHHFEKPANNLAEC